MRTKTHSTTHCLLLCHVYPHRKKLQHLRTRIASSHQSPDTLATSPHSHERPSHHPNRPHKPYILENTVNNQQESHQMVHRTPRLSPSHQTCTWKDTCSRRHVVKTTRSRQRRRRQHRRHTSPRTPICQTSR